MREEKDLAKIGRSISAAAAACLPLTACSCEPVLGMTANGLLGTLDERVRQYGLRYICKLVEAPFSPYVDLNLISNPCHANISHLATYFIFEC